MFFLCTRFEYKQFAHNSLAIYPIIITVWACGQLMTKMDSFFYPRPKRPLNWRTCYDFLLPGNPIVYSNYRCKMYLLNKSLYNPPEVLINIFKNCGEAFFEILISTALFWLFIVNNYGINLKKKIDKKLHYFILFTAATGNRYSFLTIIDYRVSFSKLF